MFDVRDDRANGYKRILEKSLGIYKRSFIVQVNFEYFITERQCSEFRSGHRWWCSRVESGRSAEFISVTAAI